MDRGTIETVFVSGRLGHAIYYAEDEVFLIPPSGLPTRSDSSEFQDILRNGAEFQVLHQRTLEQIQTELQKLIVYHDALFLVLSLLDPDVALSTKVVAAQSAEQLILESGTESFVRQRLLSIPLPLLTRTRRHQLVSPWAEFSHLKALLSEVFESQPVLDELWAAWKRNVKESEIEPAQASAIEAALVSGGLFYDSLRAISAGDHHQFNSVFVRHAVDPGVAHELGQSKNLLTSFRSAVHGKFFSTTPRALQRQLKFKRPGARRLSSPVRSQDRISDLIDGLNTEIERPSRQVGALEAKARVDKQISSIRDLLFAGKESTAEKYLQELLEFQLGLGDRKHAAMSLCNLTSIAIEADQLEMADRLSQYAVKLTSDDEVVYTVRANVFKSRGHFDAAISAYEEAMSRFGRYRYALNGLADVLKEKGQYDKAIKLYRETQQDYPEDPVAFNGEVGVLKVSGEQRAALTLAIKYAKKFEFDPVTRSSLAGCLASVGKYDDALRHYRAAISLNPTDMLAQINYLHCMRENGDIQMALTHADNVLKKSPRQFSILNMKASLLRSSGRLEEAERAYRDLIELYPTYIPAKIGIAAIRVLQRKSEEARTCLGEEPAAESQQDWFGFRVRALSYASAGDYRRASPRLSSGITSCPWLKEKQKLGTALAVVELQRGDLDRSIGLLNRGLERLDSRDQQIRLVLLAHAHAQRGARDVATLLLGRRFRSKERNLSLARESIVREYDLPLEPSQHTWGAQDLKTTELAMAMAA